MKLVFGLFVLFTVLFSSAFAVETEDGVYVLTNDNFQSWIEEQEFALVEFYAPWCGHCKNLAPHYAEAAQALAAADSKASLAKVDATENAELAQLFGVRGYPTLYWFSKEAGPVPAAYDGPREAEGIIQWISKQTVNTIPEILSQESLNDLISTTKPNAVIVLYGESEAYSTLVSLNRASQDAIYVQITNENEFGGNNAGDVVVYPSHKDSTSTTFVDAQSLADFIAENAYPNVVEFSNANFRRLASKNFVIIGVDAIDDEEKNKNLYSIFNQVAESRSDEIGFMVGDAVQLKRGIEGAGATGNVFPTLVAIDTTQNTQLVFDETQEFNSENVGKWIDGLKDGTTTQFKKSEDIPEDDGSGVKTLVAKNFDSIKGKNSLVKYYAPWCGHCKSLAPIYEELGDHFRDSDVIIGKIDATANYIEEQISGFPTLIWYSADGSSEKYEGARDLPALKSFVSEKLSHVRDEL